MKQEREMALAVALHTHVHNETRERVPEQVFCTDLQADDVPAFPQLLLIELSFLFLRVLDSDIVVGVKTFGLGLRQKKNS